MPTDKAVVESWRQAAIDGWYGSQDHVGQADIDPEPHASAAGDAAVRVVLKYLRAIAAEDGNLDDGLWYERFTALLGGDLEEEDLMPVAEHEAIVAKLEQEIQDLHDAERECEWSEPDA